MSSSQIEQSTSAAAEVDEPETTSRDRSRRRKLLVVSLATVVVLGVGGGVAAARWNANLDADVDAAVTTLYEATMSLDQVRAEGRSLLASSAERVEDNGVRVDLGTALTAATRVMASEVPEAAGRRERVELSAALSEQVDRAREDLVAVIVTVGDAVTSWELEQAAADYAAAVGELKAVLDAAGAVLEASEGQVTDEAVRVALTEAIQAATTVLEAEVAQDTTSLTAGAGAVREQAATLGVAQQQVVDDQAAWTAEQERIAAEQAAAAAAAAAQSGSGSGGKSSGSSTSSSGSGGGSSSSGKTGTSTGNSAGGSESSGSGSSGSDGSRWVESGSDTWCDVTDTSGAEGTGGWC